MSSEAVLERAREWAAHDPNPADAAAVLAMCEAGDHAALAQAFHGPLAFGTAGLRAKVGPGESQLNSAVIRRTTYGLVQWLLQQVETPKIVIGCDARHGSAQFQRDAAEVACALGAEVLLLPAANPTPLTAFAVKLFGADAGVMVTASHNPPQDNGYKVYLGGRVAQGPAEGVQIIAPADKEIAAAIAQAPFADAIECQQEGIREVDPRDAYRTRAASLAGANRDLRIVLTAMHGVGAALGGTILRELGFEVIEVAEQCAPDPDFPTVSFPNPEEPGALDLALAKARETDADIVIAYDPDADRCACAVEANGQWRQLSGDEVGALLGSYLAERGATGAMANSIVSSRLLGKIATDAGLEHRDTLTGFKWIARTPALSFGYEEAIGYCCDPEAVADKDGISASVVLASFAADLKAQGSSLPQALAALAQRFGLYQTRPLTFRVEDLSLIGQAMQRLRANPPSELAGAEVTEVIDLAEGTLPAGATEGIMVFTDHNDRVVVRPSGTEPKLKCYLEVVIPASDENLRALASERLDRIAEQLRDVLDMPA